MKSKNTAPRSSSRIETPKDEFLTAAALLTAGKYTVDGARAAYSYFKPDEILGVHVLNSALNDEHHRVVLKIVNVSANGVYLENMFVSKPSGHRFDIFVPRANSWTSKDITVSPEKYFPVIIPFQDSLQVILLLKKLPEPGKSGGHSIRLAYEFTELTSTKGSRKKEQDIAIRWRDDRFRNIYTSA